jgi:hypothetical protein
MEIEKMTTETTTKNGMTATEIQAVTIDQVARVYSGRPGCGCGCRGKYYPSIEGAEPTSHERAMMTRILRQVQANPTGATDGIIYSETNRNYWVYLKDVATKPVAVAADFGMRF